MSNERIDPLMREAMNAVANVLEARAQGRNLIVGLNPYQAANLVGAIGYAFHDPDTPRYVERG